MGADVERKLTKWGNGYGFRLTAAEVRELGLREGGVVRAHIEEATPKNDLDALPTFRFGGRYDIKKILEEEST